MLAPLAVEYGEQHVALEVARVRFPERGLALVICVERVLAQELDELVPVEVGPTAGLLLEDLVVE
jgi:hypothetical protein